MEIKSFEDVADFCTHIQTYRRPAILRNFRSIGSCLERWKDPCYLQEKLEDKVAKIHKVEKELADQMDFRTKNFQYQSLPMADLIQHIFQPRDDHKFAYYLRWVGDDRGQTKANFHLDFPSLAQDFRLPPDIFFPEERFFSSVLRLSSDKIRVWTHYDVMDNIYVQVVGTKQVKMWAPNEALNLYLDSDKSKVVDLNDPELSLKFPKFSQAIQHKSILGPGDILFIPALWFHNMKATSAGVAINVFWKNLDPDLYDKKDPYGNKDLLPAAKASRMLDNVWHQLDSLPEDYRDFYGRQLIARLEKKCLTKKDITE